MEPAMLVRYEMTKEDLLAFNLHRQRRSPTLRRGRTFVTGLVVALGATLGVIPLLRPGLEAIWLLSFVLILSGLLMPFQYRRGTRKALDRILAEGRNKGILGLKEVRISEVEISVTAAVRSVTVRWPGVEKVVTTPEALYVYISSLEAIVVPRRAFEKPEEFEAFAAAATRFLAEAEARTK